MRLTIHKYTFEGFEDKPRNYFSKFLYKYDSIVMDKFPLNFLPNFREEWADYEGINNFKSGYFDLRIPLSLDLRSTLGRSLRDFLLVSDVVNQERRYMAILDTDPDGRSSVESRRIYCGFIEPDRLSIDLTPGARYVSLSVTGIEKELVDHLKLTLLQRMPNAGIFNFEETYLPAFHFKDVSNWISFESQLNINARVGSNVKVDSRLQSGLFDGGLNDGYSVWEGLKSILLLLGCRFKVIPYVLGDYPKFKLILYWRSYGSGILNHPLEILQDQIGQRSSETRAVFLPVAQAVESTPNVDYYGGLLFSLGETSIQWADPSLGTRFGYVNNQKIFQWIDRGGNVQTYKDEDVTWIAPGLHAVGGWDYLYYTYKWNLAYNRIIYAEQSLTQSQYLIYRQVTIPEYRHYLRSLRQSRELKIKVPPSSNIRLGIRVNYDAKEYILERITNYNPYNQTMSTEWIEGVS